MKKMLLLGLFALVMSAQANAGYISLVTGADMAGMKVTVNFGDQSSETVVWDVLTQDASVPFFEGFSGGVFGSGWSLTQAGNTISETPSGVPLPLGAWTLEFQGGKGGIVSIIIDGLSGGIVFDTEEGDASANGSQAGRQFLASMNGVLATFSDNVEDELFGTMTLGSDSFFLVSAQGGGFQFIIDTDKIAEVSAPATMGVVLAALGLLGFNRRKRKG